jgi:hypothetical protein
VPPSIAYPVLAYRPGQPVEALAPWSTLRPASDPSCADKSGYRALVMPAESWLTLVRGGEATDQDWGMIAALRWSKERVCLEAVELADQTFMVAEEELQTRVTASFVGKPEAARLGFALGLELRQPLTCELRAQP